MCSTQESLFDEQHKRQPLHLFINIKKATILSTYYMQAFGGTLSQGGP